MKILGFKINTFSLVLLLIFAVLAVFVSQLRLYLDDAYFISPAIKGDFISHFQTYIYHYGLFRPFTLLYYYFIFKLFTFTPILAHLIPLVIYFLTGYLIFRIFLLQNIRRGLAVSGAILILSLPFAVEAYGWLSANSALLVIFLLFLQIYLLEKYNFNKKIIFYLVCLQLFSVFIYESTFFTPFVLFAYLLLKSKSNSIKIKLKSLIYIISTFLPILVYIGMWSLFPAKIETRIKTIDLNTIYLHWHNLFSSINILISPEGFQSFWRKELFHGLVLVLELPLILFCVIIAGFFLYKNYIHKEERIPSGKSVLFFWLALFICSLIPLSWQNNYLPFRLLFLPVTLLLILTVHIINKYLNHLYIIFIITLMSGLSLVFFLIQIGIVDNYRLQYLYDLKIVEAISKDTPDWNRIKKENVSVYIKNLPYNNINAFTYGDYLFGIFNNFWSGEYFYYISTGVWKHLAIRLQAENIYRSRYTEKEILEKGPWVFTYTDNLRCLKNDCFRVVKPL